MKVTGLTWIDCEFSFLGAWIKLSFLNLLEETKSIKESDLTIHLPVIIFPQVEYKNDESVSIVNSDPPV
jgi:hypothetical protein